MVLRFPHATHNNHDTEENTHWGIGASVFFTGLMAFAAGSTATNNVTM
ncbi:MAG: hypothetical protein IH946_11535 [Bacteroidetes bacterium]|nr:hypothetical protein [Bacteroidota bacterium]